MLRLLTFLLLIFLAAKTYALAPPDCNPPQIQIGKYTFGSFDASETGLPKPSCGFYIKRDKWFKFVPTEETMTIEVVGVLCDPAFAVYFGQCPNVVPVDCSESRDCGKNDNPALTFTNLVPGLEYFLRVWPEEPHGPIHSFCIKITGTDVENFNTTVGSAQIGSPDDCSTLTNSADQTGCAWYSRVVQNNIERFVPVDLKFKLNFGNQGAAARDGMAFVMSTASAVCGNGGYGLGAEGMVNSLIVEFDTWDDGVGSTPDIADDHITLFINGDFSNAIAGPFTVPGLPEFADGNDHEFQFKWDPTTALIQCFLDGNLIININSLNPITDCFGGHVFQPFRLLHFGFTASTTGVANNFSVCYDPHFEKKVPQNETVNEFLCQGFSYTSPNGNVYSTGGTFTENFLGANGCEATRKITLTMRPLPKKTLDVFICEGQDYQGYNSTGQYTYNKPGTNCDTVITLNLTTLNFDINVNKSGDINCMNDESSVFAFIPNMPTGSEFDPEITYNWVTGDGLISSGQGTDGITVTKGGTYSLEVNISGVSSGIPYNCTVVSFPVTVGEHYDLPDAKISVLGELSCISNEMSLDGGLSGPFPLTYQWTTVGGSIAGSANGSFISLTQPGKYILLVTHEISGCTDTASFIVKKQGFTTTADIIKTSDIDCKNDTITISATLSDQNADHMEWTTPDGNIITDPLLDEIKVNQAGQYILTLSDENGCSNEITIDVEVNTDIPTVQAGPDKILDCNNSSALLTGTITTNSTNYGFQWVDQNNNLISDQDLNINVNLDGFYILNVIDSVNFCTSTDTVEITTNDDAPQLQNLASQKLTCILTSINLNPVINNPGNDITFEWTTADGNITGGTSVINTTADQTGTYRLIAKNIVNGCADTISTTITGSIDQPTATAGNDVTLDCHNPFSVADGTFASNDPSNIDINWTTINGNIQGPTNGLTINVASPGLYIISVTNNLNGCTDTDTLEVVKNDDKPIVNFDPVVEITCAVGQVNIVPVWTNAGQNPTVTWATLDGNILSTDPNSVIIVNEAGEYNLTIVNEETGCITTGGVIIVENKVEPLGDVAPPDEITCTVKTVDLIFTPDVAGNYSYEWSTANGNISAGGNSASATVDQEGNYTIEVTNNDNGCISTFQAVVQISSDLPVVNAGSNGTLNCIVLTTELNGTVNNVTNYDVSWSAISGGNIVNGGNTLKPTVNQSGSYVITIENTENGCVATDTVEIVSNITEPEFVTPEITDADCSGENGAISFASIDNAQAPYTFKINNVVISAPDLNFDGLNSGSYNIEITDGNGCKSTFDADIDQSDQVSMTLPDTLVLLFGQQYTGLFPEFQFDTTGMTINGWTGATYLSCNDCINPTLTPNQNATLTFKVTNAEGCVAEDEVVIRVRKKSGDYFVPNLFSPFDRNGINDFITVYTDGLTIPQVDEFRIFNRWGTEVFGRTNFKPNQEELGWDGKYKGSMVTPGVFVYFAKMKTVDGDIVVAKGSLTVVQ